jgi:uncharacterized SAM-binding protein YcdF (DUF218 family)
VKAAVVIASVAIVAGLLFRSAGNWLVVDDPLRPANAIVVLGGGLPFRALEGAALYRQGVASEVWLTKGFVTSPEESALDAIGIERPTEYELSTRVLEQFGVPASAIRVLPPSTPNTADEVRAIARELQSRGGSRVVLVTSKVHTRRVRLIWNRLIGDRPEAVIRYARQDPSDTAHWWRRTTESLRVAREWFGILNALAGFPIKTT